MKHDETTPWAEHIAQERSFHPGADMTHWYKHVLNALSCWEVDNKGTVLEVGAGEGGGFSSLVPHDSYAIVDPLWGDGDSPFGDLRIPAESLPMPDETFDLVIVSNAIDHCEYPGRVATEMVRVLLAGGSLLCGHFLDQRPHPWSFESLGEMTGLFPSLAVRCSTVMWNRAQLHQDFLAERMGFVPSVFPPAPPSECGFAVAWLDKPQDEAL